MQQTVGTPVVGLLALMLVGCAEGHSLSQPDASTTEPDASTTEPDASTTEPDASTTEPDASILTDDATLASLSLVFYANGELASPQIPEFDPTTSTYTIDVGLLVDEVQVSATPSDDTASITASVDGDAVEVEAGVASEPIQFEQDEMEISLVVTALSGAQQTYTMNVNRASEMSQRVYAKADNTGSEDFFGYAISLSGDTLAVGAPYEDSGPDGNGDSAPDSGMVYVFARKDDGSWVQQGRLKASNAESGDNFGYKVSLSGDTLAVSAPFEDSFARTINGNQGNNLSGTDSGAVYIFTRSSNGTWDQKAYIKPSNTDKGDQFGFALSLSGDTLAVGAPYEDSAATTINGSQGDHLSGTNSGAVYVFTRLNGDWSQEAYIKASNTEEEDNIGYALSLSGDTLAVGAPHKNKFGGAVYVFTSLEGVWSEQVYIHNSIEYQIFFGFDVSLSGDTLAVGTRNLNAEVYIFTRTDEEWSKQYTLVDPDDDGNFGYALSLSGDTLAVGARSSSQDDTAEENSGAVYLFSRTSTGTEWLLHDNPLDASNAGEGDEFGFAVSLSGDTLAAGARYEDSSATDVYNDGSAFIDNDSAKDSGAVYLFQ